MHIFHTIQKELKSSLGQHCGHKRLVDFEKHQNSLDFKAIPN
jgi:hypothetical protein